MRGCFEISQAYQPTEFHIFESIFVERTEFKKLESKKSGLRTRLFRTGDPANHDSNIHISVGFTQNVRNSTIKYGSYDL